MPEPILLAAALVAAFAAVLLPLRRPAAGTEPVDRSAAELRHRVALESLRDVEADHRAGSLDEDAYRAQLAEAEARAVASRRELEAIAPSAADAPPPAPRRAIAAIGTAVGLAAVLLGASLVPATGIANTTTVDQALADAQAREAIRQERIEDLVESLSADPEDAEVLSELADAYLAGTSREDLVLAATLLRALIDLEPDRADAYERIIAAYLRADDYPNARSALDAYGATASADPVEVAFFDGIIALRGEDDPEAAVAAFDRFLELAPDDPRTSMVQGLRDEAADAAD
jgi:cytochrome c-type biogenesis protein CcmH